jgi:hypothetical protein
VLTLGLASLARLQLWLWTGSDAARQQTEATRLAQQDIEGLRPWARLDSSAGQTAYADITAQAAAEVTRLSGNTRYQLEREVADNDQPRFKAVTTRARWTDREGSPRSLALQTFIAGVDPFWQGALVMAPRASDVLPTAMGRHAAIPIDAITLPDGRVVWKVDPASTIAWVFDRSTGRVLQQCSTSAGLSNVELTAASLGGCLVVAGLPVWGAVRFATDSATPGPAEAANPPSAALDLDLRITLSSPGHPSPGWVCEDNSATAVTAALRPGAVRYLCVVQPAGTPLRWSGRLDLVPVGWTLGGASADALRVCRYSTDRNSNGRIDNAEHPASYTDVDGPLGNQNFLVIPLVAACPQDQAMQLGSGEIHLSDVSTLPHQP